MDGWMDGQKKQMDGWMDEYKKLDGYKNGRLDGQQKKQMKQQMVGRIEKLDGWMYCLKKYEKHSWMVGWT